MPNTDLPAMKFAAAMIAKIKNGEKTVTRRPIKTFPAFIEDFYIGTYFTAEGEVLMQSDAFTHLCRYKVGEHVRIDGSDIVFKITQIGVEQLRHAVYPDHLQEEGFSHAHDFIEFWDSVYGDTEYAFSDERWVWVYVFEVLNR